jgi:prepilin-type N-terminal cleavage/methylation domain-containing protein
MKNRLRLGQNKLGFSLIELSVVILVLGILTIGITQGSRIVLESRLKSARSLTAASPVNATPNLTLWLDTTSANAFDSNVVDGSAVANWYGINNQNNNAVTVVQATPARRPTYLNPV